MPRNFRYWGFISYSHADRALAERLHAALEGYRVPARLVGLDGPFGPAPARLQPIFRDLDELNAGGELGATVRQALEVSRSLIVVCSPNAATSHWVDAEAEAFQQLHPDGPLFCVLGGDVSTPIEQCLPTALKPRFVANPGIGETAPIAVDLRAGGDGLRKGVQKIVAGLAGLPLDQLVQRDAQRRHRRMAWLAAGLAAVSLAMGVLAFSAYRSRDEARFQRAQAEGLIEFMLVDLRKKLEPHGRLDAMDAVGDRALQYYDAQAPKSLDPDSLGRRARALHLIGEINDRRGDTRSARAAFARARSSTAELLGRSPGDPARLYDHAQSVFWNGYIDWQYGDTKGAERAFTEYGRLARELSAKDPSNPDWLAEVGYAHSNLGTLLMEQGRAAEAIPEFRDSLRINRRRIALSNDPGPVQLDIGQDRSWLSSALYADRRLKQAVVEREAEIAIYDGLLRKSPDDMQVKARKMLALRFLGELQLAAGDMEAAKAALDGSIALAEEQKLADPDSTGWQQSMVRAQLLASQHARRTGALPKAEKHVDIAAALVATQLQRDPEAVVWRLDLQESLAIERSTLLIGSGRIAQADKTITASSLRLQELQEAPAFDLRTLRFRMANAALQAQLSAARNEPEKAQQAWGEVIRISRQHVDRLDADSACVLANAYRQVGKQQAAESMDPAFATADHCAT